MAGESPSVVLYDFNGNALAVQNSAAIPTNTPAILVAGSDGTNSHYLLMDGYSRTIVAGAGVAGTPTGGVLTIQGVSGGTVVPVSGTVTANAGTGNFNNASVSTTAATPPGSATYIGGSVTTAAPTYTTGQMNALSLTTAGALRVDGSAVTQPVSGTVTANAGTGNFNNASVSATAAAPPASATYAGGLVTTAVESGLTNNTINALSMTTTGLLRVDGSNVTQPVSGTVTANAGTGNFNNASVSATGAAPPASATFAGGSVTTAAPTYTTGQMSALSLTTAGALRVDASATTQPVSGTVTANQGTAGSIANSWPVEITDGTNVLGTVAHPVNVTGTITTNTKSTTGTFTSVAAATSSTTVLASNTNRLGATFYNDSTAVLYLGLSATAASTSAYSIRLLPNSYFDLPIDYTGQINGIWSAASGNVRVTEMT